MHDGPSKIPQYGDRDARARSRNESNNEPNVHEARVGSICLRAQRLQGANHSTVKKVVSELHPSKSH